MILDTLAPAGVDVMFIESVLDDESIEESNIRVSLSDI